MSTLIPDKARLLPFNREIPGAWQRWEDFWVDFLLMDPLLPCPGRPPVFKRVVLATKYGVGGGDQAGIDIKAEMDDGSILAVQCKNRISFGPTEARVAMDKAEREFPEAEAYFLVLTKIGVSRKIEHEAERRGNWRVVGRDDLSSWFFSGKLLEVGKQKDLIWRHFTAAEFRDLFPHADDSFLVGRKSFFERKNLIPHGAKVYGEGAPKIVKRLTALVGGESKARVAILIGPGGVGKTRLMSEVAKEIEDAENERVVFFRNDTANAEAEDFTLRGSDLKDASVFVDDAHRLENLRGSLLELVCMSAGATLLIGTRPNSVESLKRRLLEVGFLESDWEEFTVPALDWQGRRALAVELLGFDDHTANELANQSKDCPLICTVGAELIRGGKIERDLVSSDDFRRRVFDHLMESALKSGFPDDLSLRTTAEDLLRVVAMAGPITRSRDEGETLGKLIDQSSIKVGRVVPVLEEAGLLRLTRRVMRVVPDLLADHLVYDTAYGRGRNTALINRVIVARKGEGFAQLFGNLAEGEWRAKQEGKEEDFLGGMWSEVREMLKNPEDDRIYGLLSTWRKFAVFQPERTLELAGMVLDAERERVSLGRPEVVYEGHRYDSIAPHLYQIPELLAPVIVGHKEGRLEAFDLLLNIALIGCEDGSLGDDLPESCKPIVTAARFVNWDAGVPQDVLKWLKAQVDTGKITLRESGMFLDELSTSWFNSPRSIASQEAEAIENHSPEIHEFRLDVIDWIETKVVPAGAGATWEALPTIFRAGLVGCSGWKQSGRWMPNKSQGEELVSACYRILEEILKLYPDPVIRLSIWQFLSRRLAGENPNEWIEKWSRMRSSIVRDLPFEMARIASSFAVHEWNHENLILFEGRDDYDLAGEWWAELAKKTIEELRERLPMVSERLEQFDKVGKSLSQHGQRASWDVLASAWAEMFPEEREEVVEGMLGRPSNRLVPAIGYFLGLSRSSTEVMNEPLILRALSNDDIRIRLGVLSRLSWRRVPRSEAVAKRLTALAKSDDPIEVSAMVKFTSWNKYEPGPYFDEVLGALNVKKLAINDLSILGSAIADVIEHSERHLALHLVSNYFDRLCDEEDLNKVLPENSVMILHGHFPREMFDVHLKRIRKGFALPWSLDDWSLMGLSESPDFEELARSLFEEAMQADNDGFHRFRELFDRAVRYGRPDLAGTILQEGLKNHPLEKVVDMTGVGNGSVMYHGPDFARELLRRIKRLPTAKSLKLWGRLVFLATPHSWSMTGGEVDSEYRWARDLAASKIEEFRGDSLLQKFFEDVLKDQEQLFSRERGRCREDD